ncbi:MAG: hypothetical protein Kow0031_07010 [Anaerolineae bacterium]
MVKNLHLLKTIWVLALLMGLALIVMACDTLAPAPPTPPSGQDPMENWESFDAIVATSEPTRVPIAVVPPPTPTKVPTPTPPPAIMAPDDGCVACHSSEEMLKETAKEEEVAEVLSEGEG